MKNKEIIVANSDADFDALFGESALVAVFMTAKDYEQFSEKNLYLTDAMEAIVSRLYEKTFAENHIGIGYDWWPDHTRHVECDIHCLNQELFDAICALLVNEYDEWRIQVVVFEDVMNGKTMIGSVTIWSNKFLIDARLYEWMLDKGFDFGTTTPARLVSFDKKMMQKRGYTILDEVE